jgi:two-component system sensor histidine kinase HydH
MMQKHAPLTGKFLSLLGTAGIFILCTVLGFGLLRSQLYTHLLLARNEAEQTQNSLFTAMRQERLQEQTEGGPRRFGMDREFSDVAEILDEYPALKEKIAGIGTYSTEGKNLFRYGEIPAEYPPPPAETPGFLRNYVIDEATGNLHIVTLLPPPHMRKGENAERAVIIVFSMKQDEYWQRNRAAYLIFSGWEILLAIVLWRVRSLLAKNRVYSQKLQEQKELVALGSAARTLAHEIKNPLSAIQLQADIISRVCPEKIEAELDAITQEVARLRRLTDRIGDFLREPKGMPVPVDLGDFTRNIVRRSGCAAVFSSEESAWIFADPDRLQSIVENLLRNALESGGASEDVAMKVSREGPSAVLEVLDRGSGLPEGAAGRLFDPFFTTKSKGSGVGLAIARRFAEAAGGSLKVENREGGGVRAILKIPLAEETRK